MGDSSAKVVSLALRATAKAVASKEKPDAVRLPHVYEMWGVILGDPPGSLRAWSAEAPAWSYGKVMKLTPKRYRIIEID